MHCSFSFLFSLLLPWDIWSGLWLFIKVSCYSWCACHFRSGLASFRANAKLPFFPPTLFWKIIFWGLTKRARTQETPSQTAGAVCFHIAVLYKENPVGSVIAGYLGNIHKILSYGCIPHLEILLGDQEDLKGYTYKEDLPGRLWSESCHRAFRLPHLLAFFPSSFSSSLKKHNFFFLFFFVLSSHRLSFSINLFFSPLLVFFSPLLCTWIVSLPNNRALWELTGGSLAGKSCMELSAFMVNLAFVNGYLVHDTNC